jgi:hypothetical protein
MRSESGQATVEWVGLVLLVALALGALAGFAPRVDRSSLGAVVAGRLTCAVKRDCRSGFPGSPPLRAERPAAARVASAGVLPMPRGAIRGKLPGLLRKGAEKGVEVNGLLCYIRKSTAPNDTNRVGDDIADAINCLNPIDSWTGSMGGTDD